MVMDNYIVFRVSNTYKEQYNQEIESLNIEEAEAVIRIGLYCLHELREYPIQINDMNDIKTLYEQKLLEKDKERDLLERVWLHNQDTIIQSKCKEYQETIERLIIEKQHHQDDLLSLKEELIRVKEAKNAEVLTSEIIIRNRVNDFLEEKRTYYQTIIDDLRNTIELYKNQCKEIELKYTQTEFTKISELQKELQETKDKLNKSLLDSETSKVNALTTTIELQQSQISEILNKRQSSVLLGQEGEGYFSELAEEVFNDYDGFEIVDTTKIAHSGDFHLTFREFTILVDTKNFIKGKVSTVDLNKFYFDMTRNLSIKIGWLVCLNGYVGKFAKRPFVFEIRDGSLLVFVNNLKNQENPKKVLEDVFYMSQFLYNTVINVESTTEILANYKRYERRVNDMVTRLVKQNKQIGATMTQLRNDLQENEKLINEMLREDIMNVRNEHTTVIEDWFHDNLVVCEGAKLKSNALYDNFLSKTNANTITIEMFKSVLKTVCDQEHLQLPKNDKSQYVLLGYKIIV